MHLVPRMLVQGFHSFVMFGGGMEQTIPCYKYKRYVNFP